MRRLGLRTGARPRLGYALLRYGTPCPTSPRPFVLEPERSAGYRPTWLLPGCPGSVIFSLE